MDKLMLGLKIYCHYFEIIHNTFNLKFNSKIVFLNF